MLFIGTAVAVTASRRRQKISKGKDTTETSSVPPCQVVFVLGGPGAGKGTQCQLLQERLGNWVHLSAGDLLRAERKKGGPIGDLINARIASGQFVPAEITCRLLEMGMAEAYHSRGITKFLIDGYPRNQDNVSTWADTMGQHKVEFVLFFQCPEEVLQGRLLARGETSGRMDDNMEVIRKRFKSYMGETYPIVQLYENVGLVRPIASDKPVESV